MPSSTLDRGSLDAGPRLASLLFGIFAGPAVWAALLETNYVLSYVACEQKHNWMLYVTAVVGLAIIALGALAAWRAAPPGPDEGTPTTSPRDTAVVRARFMAIIALGFCAFFALVVIATEIPAIVLRPCSW